MNHQFHLVNDSSVCHHAKLETRSINRLIMIKFRCSQELGDVPVAIGDVPVAIGMSQELGDVPVAIGDVPVAIGDVPRARGCPRS